MRELGDLLVQKNRVETLNQFPVREHARLAGPENLYQGIRVGTSLWLFETNFLHTATSEQDVGGYTQMFKN